jgi:hypothetical protein
MVKGLVILLIGESTYDDVTVAEIFFNHGTYDYLYAHYNELHVIHIFAYVYK